MRHRAHARARCLGNINPMVCVPSSPRVTTAERFLLEASAVVLFPHRAAEPAPGWYHLRSSFIVAIIDFAVPDRPPAAASADESVFLRQNSIESGLFDSEVFGDCCTPQRTVAH